MTPQRQLKQGNSFHAQALNLSGQPTEKCFLSASETKPTTEAPKHSHHPHQSMLQSHPFGSSKRLSELTTNTETNKNTPSDKIHPKHFKALQCTGPVTKKIQTLTKQRQHNEEAKTLKQANGLSNLVKNLMHAPNILQPNSMTQTHHQSTNAEEQFGII